MNTVGFVGLGIMGRPMAGNLLAALGDRPDRLLVHSRRKEPAGPLLAAGARWAQTPADLAACRVLVAMVPDLPQLEPLLDGRDGIAAHLTAPMVLVVCSTVSPEGVAAFGERWNQRTGGLLRVVDAPVSGGEEGAAAGTLSIMVGGADDDVATAVPVLATMGTPVHFGALGAGSVVKACNQMIVAATLISLGESVVIAERSGIDVAAMLDLLGSGLAGSAVLQAKKTRLATADYTVSGPARFLVKDLGFAKDAATATGVRAPQLDVSHRTFADLTDRGLGDQDTAVIRAYVEATSAAAAG